MPSSDFRHITLRSDRQKADRLFRAAVSAFCALPRPSRREIAQLEDLALPLFDHVSTESKRYVAAALSECVCPPAALVRQLADESVDIAAPLLIRSKVFSDFDLVALIGRHGYGHARAIGRREGLNPAIAELAAALERKVGPLHPRPDEACPRLQASGNTPDAPTSETGKNTVPAVEETRSLLRTLMRPASPLQIPSPKTARTAYDRLREAVLSGSSALFQSALAEALRKDFSTVRYVSAGTSYAWLLDALRVLEIGEEKAFLITAAVYPSQFGDLQSIRLFLLRYGAISREDALKRVGGWAGADDERKTSSLPSADASTDTGTG